jgi:hypothetical protein
MERDLQVASLLKSQRGKIFACGLKEIEAA